jgi:hypothetical protein
VRSGDEETRFFWADDSAQPEGAQHSEGTYVLRTKVQE